MDVNPWDLRNATLVVRLLCGGILLASALFFISWIPLLTTALTAFFLLRLQQSRVLHRLWRMLRWLLLPVLLLHLFLTPGTLLAPQLPWSPTIEGVKMAAWLSLHLVAWLISAWLLMALISMREWQSLLYYLPYVGRSWSQLLQRIPPILHGLQARLQLLRYRWQLERGRLRDIPHLAVAVVGQVFAIGDLRAEAHWLRGNSRGVSQPWPQTNRPHNGWLNPLLLLCGTLPLCAKWLV
ncbi:MAG: hypothetical protein Q9M26_03115 [Mariprofundales bacterium]|nr:hypothetical protein [Mariprofundales bacterium]